MDTKKLILLRIYNVSLGRTAFFSRLLKRLLIRHLIEGKERQYCASSRYFDKKELENE